MEGLIIDITTLKNYEDILQHNAVELKNLNAMKDKFFSIIAHDLKNPTYAIITVTEFLKSNQENLSREEYEEFINHIHDSAKSSYLLLDNLLEWSKSQTGLLEFRPENIHLMAAITESMRLLNTQADAKQIRFKIDVDSTMHIRADQNMLNTIIRNLLSNALKFTDPDGIIEIKAFADEKASYLTIKDYGIGMTREQLQYLFRVDSRKTHIGTAQEPGSGLGLVLCKEMMDLQGGMIEVISKIGKGSTFVLTFPHA
jgi:signal transduction histidine kinase